MRSYCDIRDDMRDGDVFMLEGQTIISKLIRALTGQQISHVAMLLWIDDGLWVCEMREFVGYRLMPASLWVADNSESIIYYGIAPDSVRGHDALTKTAFKYRGAKYGYLSLLTVWWSQIRHKNFSVKRLVCSTFVERCWEGTGYQFTQLADPGDYLRLCDSTMVIS